MISFEVKDMSCGHCVSTITKAVRAVDEQAAVRVDLARHRVDIESVVADGSTLQQSIADAGFTPVPVAHS